MAHELRAPASDAEWAAYHAIRRHVLFELRGQGAAYDPRHPDEHRPGHHPMILWADDLPAGVVRIDVHAPVATLRRVAIREELQRQGYGRRLLDAAERFARAQGCTRVESRVDPSAIGFYQRCGYVRADLTDGGSSPLVSKAL
jgi:GNAT superfamily N-acetyltransferase